LGTGRDQPVPRITPSATAMPAAKANTAPRWTGAMPPLAAMLTQERARCRPNGARRHLEDLSNLRHRHSPPWRAGSCVPASRVCPDRRWPDPQDLRGLLGRVSEEVDQHECGPLLGARVISRRRTSTRISESWNASRTSAATGCRRSATAAPRRRIRNPFSATRNR
jgi:hypothetical protein